MVVAWVVDVVLEVDWVVEVGVVASVDGDGSVADGSANQFPISS